MNCKGGGGGTQVVDGRPATQKYNFFRTIDKWVFGNKNGQEVSGSKLLPSIKISRKSLGFLGK